MNDDELATILETSLKRGGFERDDLYLFDTPLAWIMTNEAHIGDDERKVVVDALATHVGVRELLNCAVNAGNRDICITPEALCGWLLTRTKQVGAIETVGVLRQFLSQPFCPCDEILALSGLVLDKPIRLSSEIELIPFSMLNESHITISLSDPKWECFARKIDGQIRRREVQILTKIGRADHQSDPSVPTAALRITHHVTPKTKEVAALVPRQDNLNLLHAITNVAAAAACVPVFPVAYWWAPSPIVPCGDSGLPYQYWSHAKGLHRIAYAEELRGILVDAVAWYFRSSDAHRQRMKISLERFNLALAAGTPVDCAIDMGIALEALLLADLSSSDQPTLAFRLRGAWLLGRTVEEREKLSREFAALYDCRSTAVHTGKLQNVVKLDGNKIPAAEFIANRGQHLAAAAILEGLKSRTTEWTRIIFGG